MRTALIHVLVYLLYAVFLYLSCVGLLLLLAGNSQVILEDRGLGAACYAVNSGRLLVLLLIASTFTWIKTPFLEKNHRRISFSVKISMVVAVIYPLALSGGSLSFFIWLLTVSWLCLLPLWLAIGLVLALR